jgi:lysophospholipase L1-like esterase
VNRIALPLLGLAASLGLTLLAGLAPASAAGQESAVVVLGDSAASGEGAGDYEPGTRGEHGDWCHRSPHAYIHQTGLAGQSISLACSGATSADVGFAASGHYGEGSQAGRLADVARRYRVSTVVVQLGANDDVSLTRTGTACIAAFLDPLRPPCRTSLGPLVGPRTAAMAGRVESAVRDVRSAMDTAGYTGDDYALVLASYAAPVSEKMVALHGVVGCPYSKADAQWGRTELFPAVSAALRGVAARTGARFLDLDRATEGHEACTRDDAAQELQRRITVDPKAFVYGGLDAVGIHLAQESFHPSAAAHAGIGHCLGELVRTGDAAAACVAGADGTTHLEAPAGAAPAPAA